MSAEHDKPEVDGAPAAKRPKVDGVIDKVPEFGPSHNGQTNLKYEYLDHTADIQLHAWGATTSEAFANVTLAMFDYITELPTVKIDPELDWEIDGEGTDLMSMLYNFMDEFLFIFSTEFLVPKTIEIVEFFVPGEGEEGSCVIKAIGHGEKFELGKHPQGTEVKAITYSNMQIHENEGRTDIYVIVDI